MTTEKWQKRQETLAEQGASAVEHCVLWTVNFYGGWNSSSSLAEDAYAIAEKEFPLHEYETAVTAYIDKGWLRILAQADCDQDHQRWQDRPAHGVWAAEVATETEYIPGNIDFTEEGAHCYYRLYAAIEALDGAKPFQTIVCYTWPSPNLLRIWAASEKDILAELSEIQSMRSSQDKSLGGGFASGDQLTRIDVPHHING